MIEFRIKSARRGLFWTLFGIAFCMFGAIEASQERDFGGGPFVFLTILMILYLLGGLACCFGAVNKVFQIRKLQEQMAWARAKENLPPDASLRVAWIGLAGAVAGALIPILFGLLRGGLE